MRRPEKLSLQRISRLDIIVDHMHAKTLASVNLAKVSESASAQALGHAEELVIKITEAETSARRVLEVIEASESNGISIARLLESFNVGMAVFSS